jgi:hypothetical protein
MSNLATEIAYLTSHQFSTVLFKAIYCGIVILKVVLISLIALIMVKTKVIGKRSTEWSYDMD